jgi:prepilin-type N-terminal cleavage/methylation domain-containing protein
MMRAHMKRMRNGKSQSGMSLAETMIAIAILLIVATGVLSLACVAVTTTENQGHLTARTAEYATDKMEQLLALAYCDGGSGGNTGTDTTQFPAVVGAGTGLAGCTGAGTIPTASIGGSSDPSNPASGYVDYLDATGKLLGSSSTNYEFIRVWQISIPSGSTSTSGLKQITVVARVKDGIGNVGLLPQSSVVALKSYPF